jgi:hypothetical protein
MSFCETKDGREPTSTKRGSPKQLGPPLKLGVLLAVLACCNLLVSCGKQSEPARVPPAPNTNAAPAAEAPLPELAKLLGKWERSDGDYVLDIKGIDGSGKMDAEYFNPNPINVSRAAALRESGTNKCFIELRDENYPGCTYSLVYEPQSDQLFGQYYQASMQQTFEVVFARRK